MRIVLLPGLDGSDVLFRPFLRHTSLEATALAYPTDRNRYEDLLPFVRDALPEDEDFVLLGWSFSGPLAVLLAADPPPNLRGLILCASFVVKPVWYLPGFIRHISRPFLYRWFGGMARAKALVGGYRSAEMDDLIRQAHGATPAVTLAERVRSVLVVDVREELARCPVPVMYLRARKDFVVPKWNVRQVQRARTDVEVVEIEGPHLALATNPEVAAQAIEAFVERLPHRGADESP